MTDIIDDELETATLDDLDEVDPSRGNALDEIRSRFEAHALTFAASRDDVGVFFGECPRHRRHQIRVDFDPADDRMYVHSAPCGCLPGETIRQLGLGERAAPFVPAGIRTDLARRRLGVRTALSRVDGAEGYERMINALEAAGLAGTRGDPEAIRGEGRYQCPACGAPGDGHGLRVKRRENGTPSFDCYACKSEGYEILLALGLSWADVGRISKIDEWIDGLPDDWPTRQAPPAAEPAGAPTPTPTPETPGFEMRGHMRFAERFARRFGDRYAYVHGIGWHEWDGQRWKECRDGAPVRKMGALVRAAYADLAELGEDARKALNADIQRCSTASGINGALELAGCLRPCAVASDKLDRKPLLFNTASGTVDLETGELRPSNPGDHLTKVAGAPFNPSARFSLWDDFLARVLPDGQVRGFIQRLIGYSMFGEVREHVMPIFTGTGANGKGTFRDAVSAAFGDYATEVDPELLMESRNPRHGTFLMELRGRRLVFCSETEAGRRFAESTMKRLVGGDPIQANRMHRDPITFDPSHTLIMLTNHLPEVSGNDPAVWRRLLVVPFDVTIPPDERDPTLPGRLRSPAGRAAVLAWAYVGYLDYRERGLDPPEVVCVRTDEYRTDSDAVGRFLREETYSGGLLEATSKALYERYETWCHENRERVLSKTALGKDLATRGITSDKVGGQMVYRGVGIKSRDDEKRGADWAQER